MLTISLRKSVIMAFDDPTCDEPCLDKEYSDTTDTPNKDMTRKKTNYYTEFEGTK